MGKVLTKPKGRVKELNQSGVYKVKYADCDANYVKRTCRSLNIGISKQLNRNDKSTTILTSTSTTLVLTEKQTFCKQLLRKII